uniref:Uncharacterized protein n=1 Tax=Trichobilharzia regenti TaxID=157069 RepID=A0AA85IR66_TRIRE|nr:unnamed protein product [Trichobilharzia regenti]
MLSVILYIMHLPQYESSFLWHFFCKWFPEWCTDDANQLVATVLKVAANGGSSSGGGESRSEGESMTLFA